MSIDEWWKLCEKWTLVLRNCSGLIFIETKLSSHKESESSNNHHLAEYELYPAFIQFEFNGSACVLWKEKRKKGERNIERKLCYTWSMNLLFKITQWKKKNIHITYGWLMLIRLVHATHTRTHCHILWHFGRIHIDKMVSNE